MAEHTLEAPDAEALRRWMPPERQVASRDPLHARDAAAAWNGVVWGRMGRGDLAWAWWDEVADERLLPWVGAERGRLLRELGLHAHAQAVEVAALEQAMDLTDVVMLRLSLAADAVGLGDAATARSRLTIAGALLDELPDEPRTARQRLRRTWVNVEVAMLEGDHPRADGLPGRGTTSPVFPPDHEHGTDFHRAKGLLFAGVVREDPGLLREAARLAPTVLRWAIELALLDAGDETAGLRASEAWRLVVPPPHVAAEVAQTSTSRRLAVLAVR